MGKMWPPKSDGFGEDKKSFFRESVDSKAYVLFLVVTFYGIGFSNIAPYVATLGTEFFLERNGAKGVDCFGESKPDEVCKQAHTDALTCFAVSSFVSLFLGVVLNIFFGAWSDIVGRKPFLLLSVAADFFPTIVILLREGIELSFYWFYFAWIIRMALIPAFVLLAYLGDTMSPHNRAMAFGWVLAGISIALIVGPLQTASGLIKTATEASWISLIVLSLSLIFTIFWLPESLPRSCQIKAAESLQLSNFQGNGGFRASLSKALKMFKNSVKLLFSSNLLTKLFITATIIGLVYEEWSYTLMFYLQEVAGFTEVDQAISYMLIGASILFSQTIALGALIKIGFSEKAIIVVGLSAIALQQALLSVCEFTPKGLAFFALAVGALGNITFPAIGSLTSKEVEADEQGSIQGALSSARFLAMGVGQLLFMALFRLFRHLGVYFPGGMFLVLLAILVAAFVQAAKINTTSNGSSRYGKLASGKLQSEVETSERGSEGVPFRPESSGGDNLSATSDNDV